MVMEIEENSQEIPDMSVLDQMSVEDLVFNLGTYTDALLLKLVKSHEKSTKVAIYAFETLLERNKKLQNELQARVASLNETV